MRDNAVRSIEDKVIREAIDLNGKECVRIKSPPLIQGGTTMTNKFKRRNKAGIEPSRTHNQVEFFFASCRLDSMLGDAFDRVPTHVCMALFDAISESIRRTTFQYLTNRKASRYPSPGLRRRHPGLKFGINFSASSGAKSNRSFICVLQIAINPSAAGWPVCIP